MTLPPGGTLRVDGWPREERERRDRPPATSSRSTSAPFVVTRPARRAGASRAAARRSRSLRRGGFGVIAGSALLHTAVFAAVAFFAPSLGATEEDPFDRDRILLMQRMLERQRAARGRRAPRRRPRGQRRRRQRGLPGARQRGRGRQAGRPRQSGRWAARGTPRRRRDAPARGACCAKRRPRGILGMLPTSARVDRTHRRRPGAGSSTAATTQNRVGHLFGGTIDDALGTGGLGLSGPGEGGGGTADFIGLGGIGALGHTGRCLGSNCCGHRRRSRPRGRRLPPEGHPRAARGQRHLERAPAARGHPAHRAPALRAATRSATRTASGRTRRSPAASR